MSKRKWQILFNSACSNQRNKNSSSIISSYSMVGPACSRAIYVFTMTVLNMSVHLEV